MCIKRVFYTVTSLYPKLKTVDFIGACIFYSLDTCTKFNLHIYGRKFCSKDVYVDYIIGNFQNFELIYLHQIWNPNSLIFKSSKKINEQYFLPCL